MTLPHPYTSVPCCPLFISNQFSLVFSVTLGNLVLLPWARNREELAAEKALIANVRSLRETVEFLVVILAFVRRGMPNGQAQNAVKPVRPRVQVINELVFRVKRRIHLILKHKVTWFLPLLLGERPL